jgi:predicted alpha/beta-fold hydrolase
MDQHRGVGAAGEETGFTSTRAHEAGGRAVRRSAALSDAEPFAPATWLPNAHWQTIYAATLAPSATTRLHRTRWETPDQDFIDVDWGGSPHERRAPLVALFHGLEGSSASHYARMLAAAVAPSDWRVAIVHFRGCSGDPNRLARAYHSGDSAEIDWILKRLRADHADGPLFALGVSLGGNALLKWLGESGTGARAALDAAAAVSAPLDLVAAGNALDRGFNRAVYTRNFLRTLKAKSLAKLARFPGLFDREAVLRADTLRAFDDAVTAPLHGFRNAEDYWLRASSKPWLAHIGVPTLILNAQDDPFMPASALPRAHEVSSAVRLHFPPHGGHVGFVSGRFPGSIAWMPAHVLSFFSALCAGEAMA